jgi:trigger factor
VLEDLEEQAEEAAQSHLAGELLDRVLDANPFEAPASMVDRWLETALGDTRQVDPGVVARARAELRPAAEAAVKRLLALDWIAAERGLLATPEEVDARIAEIAEMGQVAPEEVRSRLAKSGRLEGVARDITERKVLTFLESQSEVVELEPENPEKPELAG